MARKQAFKHDYESRNDNGLLMVRARCGMEGIGTFWCIVEMMHEQGGKMQITEIPNIAWALNVDVDVVKYVVFDCGLFTNDGTAFWSRRVNATIDHARAVSEARANAGRKGGERTQTARKTDNGQQGKPEETPATPVVPEPTPTPTPEEPETTQEEPETTPETAQGETTDAPRWKKPTIEEIDAEIKRRGYNINAEGFFAFYESKGWMIGKNHMKSWKAALTTWHVARRREEQAKKSKNNVNSIWQ